MGGSGRFGGRFADWHTKGQGTRAIRKTYKIRSYGLPHHTFRTIVNAKRNHCKELDNELRSES
jgi:hypothetical protein